MEPRNSSPTASTVTPPPAVIPTSESSWIVVTAAHDRLLGFICADIDSGYSAHDEDEHPLGTYPTFTGALSALPATSIDARRGVGRPPVERGHDQPAPTGEVPSA
jgi:hypothetical protein